MWLEIGGLQYHLLSPIVKEYADTTTVAHKYKLYVLDVL